MDVSLQRGDGLRRVKLHGRGDHHHIGPRHVQHLFVDGKELRGDAAGRGQAAPRLRQVLFVHITQRDDGRLRVVLKRAEKRTGPPDARKRDRDLFGHDAP